ncbi:MAG: hypothetical protein ACOYMB_02150 [Patescibacteria group bacterium]
MKKAKIQFYFIGGAIILLILLIAVAGFIRFNFTNSGDIIPGINATEVELSCTNGYFVSAIYYSPDNDGIMERLSLHVTKDGIETPYEMIPALSASGAKFQTEGGAHSFWEHQGEFRLVKSEEELTVCTALTSPTKK